MKKAEKKEITMRFITRMAEFGVPTKDALLILKKAALLSKWNERMCGWDVGTTSYCAEWDEDAASVIWLTRSPATGPATVTRMRNTLTPAESIVKAICKRHGLIAEFNGDPRGNSITLTLPDGTRLEVPEF